VRWLAWLDRRVLILELLVLIVFLISLGPVARVFLSGWGLLLAVAVGIGIVTPLGLVSHRADTDRQLMRGASFVLFGGLLLRMAVLFSSNAIHVLGHGVTGP
jgi:hypothetical protein